MANNCQFKTMPTFSILQYNTQSNLFESKIWQIQMLPSCPDYEIRQFNTLPSFANLQYMITDDDTAIFVWCQRGI